MHQILSAFLLLLNISVAFGQIVTFDISRNISRNSGDDFFPAWSPDSKTLVYQSNRHGNWDIFLYDTEQDTTIRLTAGAQNEQHPVWHPYQNIIVFDAGDEKTQFLYKVNLKSKKVSLLFKREVICKQPILANDGRMVYFLGYDTPHGSWELFSYHFIYDNLNQLSQFKEDGTFFNLAPDGNTILYGYSSFFYPFHRLQMYNWYGKELLKFEEFNISYATWHPDGLKIYFISDKDNLEGELYSIWKDGTHEIRLTNDHFKMREVSISPDGRSMACSVLLNGNYEIVIVPLESF